MKHLATSSLIYSIWTQDKVRNENNKRACDCSFIPYLILQLLEITEITESLKMKYQKMKARATN